MRNLARRVSSLENGDPDAFKPWRLILVDEGQPIEEAVADYESIHGSLGDDPHFIVRFIV